ALAGMVLEAPQIARIPKRTMRPRHFHREVGGRATAARASPATGSGGRPSSIVIQPLLAQTCSPVAAAPSAEPQPDPLPSSMMTPCGVRIPLAYQVLSGK